MVDANRVALRADVLFVRVTDAAHEAHRPFAAFVSERRRAAQCPSSCVTSLSRSLRSPFAFLRLVGWVAS